MKIVRNLRKIRAYDYKTVTKIWEYACKYLENYNFGYLLGFFSAGFYCTDDGNIFRSKFLSGKKFLQGQRPTHIKNRRVNLPAGWR